jgi:aspartyl-tRNA(Asn)/glutamyl-tRNA(Gln) amidotransferase subunit C
MSMSLKDLQKIAALAYLNIEEDEAPELMQEVSEILEFVEQLRSVPTTNVTPLFHPLPLNQRLRTDEITEDSCLAELKELAPLFEDDLYLVPQVINEKS